MLKYLLRQHFEKYTSDKISLQTSNVRKLDKLTSDIIIQVIMARNAVKRSEIFDVGPRVARRIVNTRICANETFKKKLNYDLDFKNKIFKAIKYKH